MADFLTAVRDLAPLIVAVALIWTAAWTVMQYARWEDERVAAEFAAAQERAERQARVNRFAAETRAAFEAQMPDRIAQVERIRARIAENETRRFVEAWDRGEVQP